MTVICKFRCTSVEALAPEPVFKDGAIIDTICWTKVKLRPISPNDRIRPNTDENSIFGTATPLGDIMMGIANQQAAKEFIAGDDYYVKFEPVPPGEE